jgi:ribonuclease HI
MSDTFTIHTDGGSRGNPGPAAFAYTIERPGQPIIEEKGYLGDTTNNIAEYTALVKALQHAEELGAASVVVNSDSELLVQQMNGKYKVKNPGILPLFQEARRLADGFDDIKIRHIYREHNSRADRLCNEALDDRHRLPIVEPLAKKSARAGRGSPGAGRGSPDPAHDPDRRSPVPRPGPETSGRENGGVGRPAPSAGVLREAAVAVIRDAAQAWADGEDDAPTPDEIWDRLRGLIREHGTANL